MSNKKNSTILGIDPGTLRMGYGLLVCEQGRHKYKILEAGTLTMSSKKTPIKRFQEIHAMIGKLIGIHNPAVLAIEDIFFGVNVKSAIRIGEARAVVMLAAANAGMEVAEYSPAVIKKSLTGNGRAEKDQVRWMVESILGIKGKIQSQDCSDALAVAICHAHHL